MKQGRTLKDLAREITRQAAQKRDYVADTSNVEMTGLSELRIGIQETEPRRII